MCVLLASLSEKQIQLYLINRGLWASLSVDKVTEQKLGLLWENAWEPQKGWKGKRGETHWWLIRNTLKYVDDLLICARDEVTCVADTVTLLNHMAREGHKVSLTKLQFCAAGNNFFWVTLRPNNKAISEKRIKAIKDVPRPLTKTLLSFLGMCAYCRTFIPNYAFLEKPLRALTTGKGLRSCDKIERPFYTDGRRSLHDFARTENVTFINSPMAGVTHDFAWHAKCNSEKMHNFESCHTSPYRTGWRGTPLLSISLGTGVYTTSRPVGHTFRKLWQCPLCGWIGVQRSTNRLE